MGRATVVEAITNKHGQTRYYVDIDGVETWITITKEDQIFDGTFRRGTIMEKIQLAVVLPYRFYRRG